MTHDTRNPDSAELPASFGDSLTSYIFGVISIEQIRRRIGALLSENQDWGPDMLIAIDGAYSDGHLNGTAYRTLITEIDLGTSEDEPTEWSEDMRAELDEAGVPATEPLMTGPANDLRDAELAIDDVNEPESPLLTDAFVVDESVLNPTTEQQNRKVGPGTLLRDRYLLRDMIGTGSMGDVYKALDREKESAGSPEPWVAVKIVSQEFAKNPTALEALKQEAAHGERLVHPNIIRVFDFDWDGDQFFMTMEWLEGLSLVDVLNGQRFQPLEMQHAGSIIQGLCHGLAHAHAHGIVHADVKPGNVFITRAGHTKLLDFGIARVTADRPVDFDATGIGAHTPAYSSAEVLEGSAPEPSDDVYSLGCVAYRMLAGRRAYGGATALAAEAKSLELQPIASLDDAQWRALKGALAWRRVHRTPDVISFLGEFFSQPTVDMTRPMPSPPPAEPAAEPRSSKGRSLKLGVSALAATVTAIAVLWWRPTVFIEGQVADDFAIEPAPERTERIDPVTPAPASDPPAALPEVDAVSEDTAGDQPAGADYADPDAAMDRPTTEEPAVAAVTRQQDDGAGESTAGASAFDSAESQQVTNPDKPIETAQPGGDAELFDSLLDSANQRMDDGLLVEPSDDSAYFLVGQLDGIAPDSPEVQQTRLRLANLMLLEAMVAISDQKFSAAEDWIERTQELGAPDAMTDRYAAELTKARDAKTARDNESLGAIFASATPAAIMADPEYSFEPPTPAEMTPRASTNPQAAALAMVLPGKTTMPDGEAARLPEVETATEPEPRLTPLSALEFRRFVKPKYPQGSSARESEGWVDVRFRVDATGMATDVEIVDAEPVGIFDDAALSAVRKWRFRPYVVDGTVTPTESGVRLRFEAEK